MSKNKYENWQNCEKCGGSNGRTILKLPIFLATFWFSEVKKFKKLVTFAIWTITKIGNFENSKNLKSGKLRKYTIRKISNLKNSKNCQFGEFRKCPIFETPKIWINPKKFAIWKI